MTTTDSEHKVLSALHAGGHKVTPQRRAVVRILARCHRHMTTAELHAAAAAERGDVGLVTVYRTLRLLADLGLVCQLSADGRQPSYVLRRPEEHHHHLVCSGCGHVVDFTSSDVERLEDRLARETGYRIEGHILEFTGQCPDCRAGR